MRPTVIRLVAFVLAWLVAGPALASGIDRERAMEHVRVLTVDIGPRVAGSEGARRAADYVARELVAAGLGVERIPVGHQDIPPIVVGGDVVMRGRVVDLADETIVARLPATGGHRGPAVLVMAHTDSVADTPGAIDNAVAVAILLELANALQDVERPHPIILAATASEEDGLAGARALADALHESVGLAVSLDLVGSPGVLTLNGLGPRIGAPAMDRFVRAARASGVRIDAPLTHRIVSRLLPQIERSDHGVFAARGVPALHLYHRGEIERIYLPYHGPLDTIDEVDVDSLDDAAAFVQALALDPAPLPDAETPAATIFFGALVVPNSVVFSVELAMLLFVVASLHRLRARPRGPGGAVRGLAFAVLAWFVAWAIVAAIEWIASDVAGHPQPWIHAPGRSIVAEVLAAGLLFAVVLGAGASRPLDPRWLLPAAIVVAALPGAALLWLGIVELAWLPLLAALALAATAWLRTAGQRRLAAAIAIVPAWLLVQPGLLREASQHHFLPQTWLLAPVLAVVLLPCCLALAHALAPVAIAPRLRVAAVVLAGVSALALLGDPPCDRAAFREYGLACELAARAQ
jgi:hypothetical protein